MNCSDTPNPQLDDIVYLLGWGVENGVKYWFGGNT